MICDAEEWEQKAQKRIEYGRRQDTRIFDERRIPEGAIKGKSRK